MPLFRAAWAYRLSWSPWLRTAGPRALATTPFAERQTWSSRYEAAGLSLAAAGAGLVALYASDSKWLRRPAAGPACEERTKAAVSRDIRVTTYNVLSPALCSAAHFDQCAPEHCDRGFRLQKLLERLEGEVSLGTVLALQEVDLSWAGKLHVFFAERNYSVVFAPYGNKWNGYMGVMMAWPRDRLQVVDVELNRLSDTVPNSVWTSENDMPPDVPAPKNLVLSWFGLDWLFGAALASKDDFREWDVAKRRWNEYIFVRLRQRGVPDASTFCIGTYHMPCLHTLARKIRVVNIHTYLLLRQFRLFASGDPSILLGDFNFKPGTSSYALASSGGDFEAATAVAPDEVDGVAERLPWGPTWPGGLQSVYQAFHSKEPPFTNYAKTGQQVVPFAETLDYIWITSDLLSIADCKLLPGQQEIAGPLPNESEPSDHIPLRATLRIKADEKRNGSRSWIKSR